MFPKAQLTPALQEHNLGSKLGALRPRTPPRGSRARSSRHRQCQQRVAQSQPARLRPSPRSPVPALGRWRTRNANLLPPSTFPGHTSPGDGVKHARRGGSAGCKATTRPTLTPGEPQQGPEPGKYHIAINPPAPRGAARLPSGSQAAAHHRLLAAATAQGEVEAAARNALAGLSASAGHDALRRPHREVPGYHGAQQTHGHPPAEDTDKQLGQTAKPKTPRAAQMCPLRRPSLRHRAEGTPGSSPSVSVPR